MRVGDHVTRRGPHLANGGVDYGNQECKVGDTGVVKAIYGGSEVSILWDKGNSSRIAASSLVVDEDEELEAEVRALFGIAPPKPCKTCGCPTNGTH